MGKQAHKKGQSKKEEGERSKNNELYFYLELGKTYFT